MADYTNSKGPQGTVFPDNAKETTWDRVEPLIDPLKLKTRHLFGIPLVSQIRDPFTNKAQVMTDDILRDYIDMSASEAEAETGLTIFPTQYDVKYPFDRAEYESFGFFRTLHRPVASVEALMVRAADNTDVFSVPLQWVDPGGLPYGQINIIPLTVAVSATGLTQSPGAGGSLFLSILGQKPWVASFWSIKTTCGFPGGMMPRIVNMLVGIIAAIKVLGVLGATYGKSTSASLSIDGASQSVTNPGPNIFQIRIAELQKERLLLTNKLKSLYSLKIFSNNV
jgi:hypothetical protein